MYAYRLSLKKDVIRYKSEASQRSVKRRRIEYLIFLRIKLDLFVFSTTTSIWSDFPKEKQFPLWKEKMGNNTIFKWLKKC